MGLKSAPSVFSILKKIANVLESIVIKFSFFQQIQNMIFQQDRGVIIKQNMNWVDTGSKIVKISFTGFYVIRYVAYNLKN